MTSAEHRCSLPHAQEAKKARVWPKLGSSYGGVYKHRRSLTRALEATRKTGQ